MNEPNVRQFSDGQRVIRDMLKCWEHHRPLPQIPTVSGMFSKRQWYGRVVSQMLRSGWPLRGAPPKAGYHGDAFPSTPPPLNSHPITDKKKEKKRKNTSQKVCFAVGPFVTAMWKFKWVFFWTEWLIVFFLVIFGNFHIRRDNLVTQFFFFFYSFDSNKAASNMRPVPLHNFWFLCLFCPARCNHTKLSLNPA